LDDDLGIKPATLTAPLFVGVAYDQGRLSCGMGSIEKHMNLRTYVEEDICVLEMRFRDELDADLEIGWTVSHKFDKFINLASLLGSKTGPLVSGDSKRVPQLTAPLDEASISGWITALFGLVPASDGPAEPVPEESGPIVDHASFAYYHLCT